MVDEARPPRAGRSDPPSGLWPLLRVIASGEEAEAIRIIATSPGLAMETAQDGATREIATAHFLDRIEHHVYAGDTALHIAAAAYATEVAKALIVRGASVRARNRRGAEPLHYASVGNPGAEHWDPAAQAAVVKMLVRAGADPNAGDKGGVTPLHRAVRTRCAAAVRALLTFGADPSARNGSGSMPLHLAVQNTGRGGSGTGDARKQQAAIIELLVAHGARLTDTDGRGTTVSDRMRAQRD